MVMSRRVTERVPSLLDNSMKTIIKLLQSPAYVHSSRVMNLLGGVPCCSIH
jgi:hypothetical protein